MANGAKVYRVVQNEGKISFRVEELWEGGVQRGPFGSRDAAIQHEEKAAQDGGFADELHLEGVIEEKKDATESFEKDTEGNWTCVEACSIEINDKEVVFTEGQTFAKGTPFMGIDVAEWLEGESSKK